VQGPLAANHRGEASAEAIAVTRDVANRLRMRDRVQRALDLAPQQTRFPQSIHWRPFAVSQGFAGLAILCGGVDAAFPNEGWDACAHDYLRLAVRGVEQQPRLHFGLYSGLAGLAFAASYLSRGHSRYRRLLATIDAALLPLIASATAPNTVRHGVDVATFDVISGLAGVGRSLLLRADESPHHGALEAVLRALVMLIAEHDGLPHWHTPPRFIADNATRAAYPGGNLNCGLAHGIPGPLALLSLAATREVIIDGQRDAIGRAAEWLRCHRTDDRWGVDWPTAVPLADEATSWARRTSDRAQESSGSVASRTAWCYGAPGIARALWFASQALADASYRELAIAAMEAVYRRPLAARQIDPRPFVMASPDCSRSRCGLRTSATTRYLSTLLAFCTSRSSTRMNPNRCWVTAMSSREEGESINRGSSTARRQCHWCCSPQPLQSSHAGTPCSCCHESKRTPALRSCRLLCRARTAPVVRCVSQVARAVAP
jgi:hypothetical protein